MTKLNFIKVCIYMQVYLNTIIYIRYEIVFYLNLTFQQLRCSGKHNLHDLPLFSQRDFLFGSPGRRSPLQIGPTFRVKVNRKAMIRNKHNQIPHHTLKTKRERRTHLKFDKRPRKTRTVYRMNSSFQNRWSFSYAN